MQKLGRIFWASIVFICIIVIYPKPIEVEVLASKFHYTSSVSRAGDKINNHNKTIEVIATAYTQSKKEGTFDGITYTGHKVRRGVVAVDPKVIPLGSKLWIEGYGYGEALDTGGAIKGYRIDLFMESKKEALQWGRKKVKAIILETGGMSNGSI
jgi:3D (Asp-Asp-Asp) domain-containing protein